jgi:hypothetical protein
MQRLSPTSSRHIDRVFPLSPVIPEEEELNWATSDVAGDIKHHLASMKSSAPKAVSWGPVAWESTIPPLNAKSDESRPPASRRRRMSSSDTSVNGPLGPVASSFESSPDELPEVFTSSDEESFETGGLTDDKGGSISYPSAYRAFKKQFTFFFWILVFAGVLHRPKAKRFELWVITIIGLLLITFAGVVCSKVAFDQLGPIACASIAVAGLSTVGIHIFLTTTLQRPNFIIVYISESSQFFGRQAKVARYLRWVCLGMLLCTSLVTAVFLLLVWRGDYTHSIRVALFICVGLCGPYFSLSISVFASLHILVCLLFKIELRHFTMKVFASAVSPNVAFSWGKLLRSHMGAFSRSFGLVLATIAAVLIMTSFPLLISTISHWRALQEDRDLDNFVFAVTISVLFLLCFIYILIFFIPPGLLHGSCLDHINQLNLAYASFDFEETPKDRAPKKVKAIRTSVSIKHLATAKMVNAWSSLQFGHFVNFNKNCDFGYQILGQTLTMATSVNIIYALVSILVVIATMAMRYGPSF